MMPTYKIISDVWVCQVKDPTGGVQGFKCYCVKAKHITAGWEVIYRFESKENRLLYHTSSSIADAKSLWVVLNKARKSKEIIKKLINDGVYSSVRYPAILDVRFVL